MIATVSFAIAALQAQSAQAQATTTQTQSAAAIISKMLIRYHDSVSLVGKIRKTTVATYGQASITEAIDTDFQFERPAKLYIKQVQNPGNGKPAQTWLVTSDGVHFSYNVPKHLVKAKSDRLVEAVSHPERKELLDVGSIYGVATQSIGDRSEILGVVLGWGEELRRFRYTLTKINAPVETTYKSVHGFKITGRHRELNFDRDSGDFEMFVSDEGDLIYYRTRELFSAKATGEDAATVIVSWDLDLHPDAKPDQSLFRVVVK